MAKLYFRYGTMNSSKSANLLMVRHNYQELGGKILVLSSGNDDRSGVGKVSSRIGLEAEATPIYPEMDIKEVLCVRYSDDDMETYDLYDVILVDECQFFTEEQIRDLAWIVDTLDIPVICYGLKTDFQGKLFEGSKALLELADKVEEIKTLCSFCDKKAIMNLRISNGRPVYDGEQIQIGGNESYKPVCRHHYFNTTLLDCVLEYDMDISEMLKGGW